MSDFDVDATMNAIESPSSGIPMHESPAVDPSAQQTQAAPEEFEFKWKDRPIKAPRDKILQWASQGYDYAQTMAAFKSEQEKFNADRQQFDEVASRYREVDEFAKTNPEWWNHVEKSWQEAQQRGAQQNPADPVSSELQSLKQQLSELAKFRDEVLNEKKSLQQQEQDRALNEEVSSIQKSYPQLDWTGVDENGLTLEMRVLQHAQANGINSFRAAFRDYNHEHLMNLANVNQREAQVRNTQQARKSGLLGTSPTPQKGLSRADNVKSKSYGDLLAEAKAELGIN